MTLFSFGSTYIGRDLHICICIYYLFICTREHYSHFWNVKEQSEICKSEKLLIFSYQKNIILKYLKEKCINVISAILNLNSLLKVIPVRKKVRSTSKLFTNIFYYPKYSVNSGNKSSPL